MSTDEIIARLGSRVSKGELRPEAMLQMAPIGRSLPDRKKLEPKNPKSSAVLIPLFRDSDEWRTVLIRRVSSGGVHGGQISFPGGKAELGETPIQTALREAHEEVGLVMSERDVVGKLSGIYIPPSNFWVEPFVGLLDQSPKLIAQPSEVEYILTPKLSEMLQPEKRIQTVVQTRAGKMKVPAFDLDGEIIWGATAMILSEFIHICTEENPRL